METNDKLVPVYAASTPGQTDIARAALEEAGIKAIVTSDLSHGILGMATDSAQGMSSVSVGEQDADAALELLAQLKQDSGSLIWSQAEVEAAGQEVEEEKISNKTIEPWPHCPECEKPRVTVCPICSTSGSEFPRAHENYGDDAEEAGTAAVAEQAAPEALTADEEQPVVKEQRLAVVCTTCDEPWRARFLRRCEWCGHDFGAGLKVDPSPQNREPAEPLNPRALFLILLIGGLLGGVFLWFMLL